jgi:hypothetical protein
MPANSVQLLAQTSTIGDFTSEKQKGDGYYNLGDGLHTVVFLVDAFKGTITLQATLAIDPSDSDWFTVYELGGDSTVFTESAYYQNISGNFVWLRAVGTLEEGTIREIRYNH